jgi:glutamate-1-semialdehyde aminotransferase
MANGFPLAAVGGRADVMAAATRTWISSTLATEAVSLAAARATLEVFMTEKVCDHLHAVGTRLLHHLHNLHHLHPTVLQGVGGIAEMCFLHYASDALSHTAARACAARGILFKRTAYNFVSLAHDDAAIDRTISVLDEVCRALAPSP